MDLAVQDKSEHRSRIIIFKNLLNVHTNHSPNLLLADVIIIENRQIFYDSSNGANITETPFFLKRGTCNFPTKRNDDFNKT